MKSSFLELGSIFVGAAPDSQDKKGRSDHHTKTEKCLDYRYEKTNEDPLKAAYAERIPTFNYYEYPQNS